MKKQHQKDGANEYWSYPENSTAIEVALYYGFTPTKQITVEKSDADAAKGLCDIKAEGRHIFVEEKAALLRAYFTKPPSQIPLMFVSEAKHADEKRKDHKTEYSLDIIGTSKSIIDATIIKTSYEIVRSAEYEDVVVEINSVGDRDSINRFMRDFVAYIKKHLGELDADCRQAFKQNPLSVFATQVKESQEIIAGAPHAMNYLSEPSRMHFMELLELLEMSSIPYTINNSLIENEGFAAHTLFRIYGRESDKRDPELLACGMRWAGLAKRMGLKKDIPGMSAAVYLKKQPKQEIKLKKLKKPQLYFIQMGQEAKLKSLSLIEILRAAKIPLYHSLTKDKLTAQLMSAEYLKVPYVLIMGQKESMENTILVREMNNRSQDTVRLEQAAEFLKKLVK